MGCDIHLHIEYRLKKERTKVIREADCSVSDALSWGGKRFIINNYEYTEHPDWHSANWCTTEEMKNAIDAIFKNEDGIYKGDYIKWLGLLGTMEGLERSGEYECRAVYWFDN